MLQQTRMDTVLPYYDRFLQAFPTIQDLAKASEDEVLKLWEGLGYYRRARNLHRSAQLIVDNHDGQVPSDPDILKTLPGIGDYVAGAVASTAYQVKTPALDGNVARIISRLECLSEDLTTAKAKRQLQNWLLDRLPDERVGDFNQSMMELGALICLPNGKPLCEKCPINDECCALLTADPLDFPTKKAKKPVPIIPRTVLVITCGDEVLVEQFGEGLLEGLSSFTMLDSHLDQAEILKIYPEALITPLPSSRHIFSHLIWQMIGYQVELSQPSDGNWVTRSQLSQLTFPTALSVYLKSITDES